MKKLKAIIKNWASNIPHSENANKRGEKLKHLLVKHLIECGYDADMEDSRMFLKPGMPVWRSKHDKEIKYPKPRARLKIDIVVYKSNIPIALIEVESDLDDLRIKGVTNRDNGYNYDVYSIAKKRNGKYFDSYKSLERMTAAAFYFYLSQEQGIENNNEAIKTLEKISSDDIDDHNPSNFPLYLITDKCTSTHREILDERLKVTGAEFICISDY
jgi:hypothetical protein